MEKELVQKVCFNYVAISGYMRAIYPDVYHALFDFDDDFTKEEADEIFSCAEESDEYKHGIELFRKKLFADGDI